MLSVIQKQLCYLCNSYILSIPRYAFQTEQKQKQQHVKFSRSSVYLNVCPPSERGLNYLSDAHLNKGLAFSLRERQALGIHGMLPPVYMTQQEQIDFCNLSYDKYAEPLHKYLYLSELQDENQRLFYALLDTGIEKFLPIVYTPTVGLACQHFGLLFRKPKGLFITIQDKGHIFKLLNNWPIDDIRVICVTDGGRILGLGDLGAFGMGIPIGKLCLYTALAGVKPTQCLPITLDVGTNNKNLLVDPLYIGLRQTRVEGDRYLEFVDEFMDACVKRFGSNILVQFEDFATHNATRLLDRYKDRFCTFNDDIQGTAAAVLAGLFGGVKIQNMKISDNVFFFYGAGSAATGIAGLLVEAMMEEGLSKEKSRGRIYMFDINGLLTKNRESGVAKHAEAYSKDLSPTKDFAKAVVDYKATCLIGVSTVANAFTPAILKQLAKNCERPMIFALSNPTTKAECTPQQAYENTEGRCIFASGSPFPPVKYKDKLYHTGQGNNAYIFPGIGLGLIAANASRVPNKMFLVSAKTVGKMLSNDDVKIGRIFPSLKKIRSISYQIAKEIVELAYEENIAGLFPKPADIDALVKRNMYDFSYPDYSPDFYDYNMNTNYKVKSIEDMAALHDLQQKKNK